MPNYQLGKIYRIDVDDEVYVGSTTQLLCKRKQKHIVASRTKPLNLYNKVNEREGGWLGIDIVLVENYPCESKEMLFARERYWIEQLNATLNMVIPTRTNKEYYEDNKESLIQKQKEYYVKNKQSLNEYNKQYQETHKTELAEKAKLRRENRKEAIAESKKKYREQNRAALIERDRQYYEQHKQAISENGKRKEQCPHCQKEMRKDSIKKHVQKFHS